MPLNVIGPELSYLDKTCDSYTTFKCNLYVNFLKAKGHLFS